MPGTFFGDLHRLVVTQIREIEAESPDAYSTEWFLLSYLRRVADNANPPSSRHGVENSMRALLRFYVDIIEVDSALGQRCRLVFETHRRCLLARSRSE